MAISLRIRQKDLASAVATDRMVAAWSNQRGTRNGTKEVHAMIGADENTVRLSHPEWNGLDRLVKAGALREV